MKRSLVSYIVLVVVCILFFSFLVTREDNVHHTSADLNSIAENNSDTIQALLLCHASDYFVYHGAIIGFQYDMLKQMAKDLGKKIFITVESDPDYVFYTSFLNKYDLVTMDINKKAPFATYLRYSDPHSFSYPILISNKDTRINDTFPNVVYVPSQFPVDINLKSLNPDVKWKIVNASHISTEDLFEMLDRKEVDFIVSDYNLAVTLLPFYPQLINVGRVGEDFGRTWVLNTNNKTLNAAIDKWLKEFKDTKKYQALCSRYHTVSSPVIQHSFGKKSKNRISSYDEVIKYYCHIYKVDWRFVSSIIFQETKFNPDVEGLGGSFGIMQIMPGTASYYGIDADTSVSVQIKVGVKHIASLYRRYEKIENEDDRLYATAAAYNAGSGHVQDAIALSAKFETDSAFTWAKISKYLVLKSQKDYYTDPVVRCGYYPGKHTINYVNEVMDRYHAYKFSYKEE